MRSEHGIQDADIIQAMNSGNTAQASVLAQARLDAIRNTQLAWALGIGALLFLLMRR
jgi:uncharacterized membrane protein YqgA involved in biofilm formation